MLNLTRAVLWYCSLLLAGCISQTKFSGTTHCPSYLKDGDQILVNTLAFEHVSFKLELLRDELKGRNVKIVYTPEEEYTLRAAGILNPLDTASYTTLLRKGITHILLIHETSYQQGSALMSQTPFELALQFNLYNPYPGHNHTDTPTTEMLFHFISLKTKLRYAFTVRSQAGSMEVRDDDGDRTTFNGSIDRARNVALKKGMQRIAENCR